MQEKSMVTIFILVATIFILLLIALIVSMLFRYRQRQLVFKKDMETLKADAEKKMLTTQLEIQEQTFLHIAREIHDNIGLSLTLAKLNLNTLNMDQRMVALEKLNASVNLIGQAIEDLRNISRSLNRDVIADQGLVKALEKEIDTLKRFGLYTIGYTITGNPVFMDSQQELVLLRIAQEAFNNIIKHANARSIQVSLDYSDQALTMEVTDDGAGFSEKSRQAGISSGLMNMKNRAILLNGSCTISGNPAMGTTVQVIIPYQPYK